MIASSKRDSSFYFLTYIILTHFRTDCNTKGKAGRNFSDLHKKDRGISPVAFVLSANTDFLFHFNGNHGIAEADDLI